jgi:hypothetical protein
LKARDNERGTVHRIYCRHPRGLRLWVREPFHAEHPLGYYAGRFRATEGLTYEPASEDEPNLLAGLPWQPGSAMTRPLSRLDLDITDLSVQRLLEASGEDAAAEGFRDRTELVEAFRWMYLRREASKAATNPWTWVLHVTARSS